VKTINKNIKVVLTSV